MMRVSAQPFEGSDLIMLVDVDEASLDRVGQWPWPRNRLATIVERVNAGGALVLVFDMFFSEPDRMSPDQVLSEMQHAGNYVAVNDGAYTLTPSSPCCARASAWVKPTVPIGGCEKTTVAMFS